MCLYGFIKTGIQITQGNVYAAVLSIPGHIYAFDLRFLQNAVLADFYSVTVTILRHIVRLTDCPSVLRNGKVLIAGKHNIKVACRQIRKAVIAVSIGFGGTDHIAERKNRRCMIILRIQCHLHALQKLFRILPLSVFVHIKPGSSRETAVNIDSPGCIRAVHHGNCIDIYIPCLRALCL